MHDQDTSAVAEDSLSLVPLCKHCVIISNLYKVIPNPFSEASKRKIKPYITWSRKLAEHRVTDKYSAAFN